MEMGGVWALRSAELETRVRDLRLESDSSQCIADLRLAWDLPDMTRDFTSKTWDFLKTGASWLETWRHRLESVTTFDGIGE